MLTINHIVLIGLLNDRYFIENCILKKSVKSYNYISLYCNTCNYFDSTKYFALIQLPTLIVSEQRLISNTVHQQ